MNLHDWQTIKVAPLDEASREAALAYQQTLTKPPGSLGQLEQIAVDMAAMQAQFKPQCDKVAITIFAADHGVAAQGVSAFPQEVTAQMVLNFASGGAAVAVLAKQLSAAFEVVNLGTVAPTLHANVINSPIAAGTADMVQKSAMTEVELLQALAAGAEAIERALSSEADLFIAGEMGIANTTSASALMAKCLGLDGEAVAGPGTGIVEEVLRHKADVIDQALQRHSTVSTAPLQVLQVLGGFEIAAMVGAYLQAAQKGLTVLVDGVISSAAAYLACQVNPDVRHWMLFGHQSAEPLHQRILTELKAQPLLNLGMRLGEGSGAAMAVTIIQQALALHADMATFAAAGVSDKAIDS